MTSTHQVLLYYLYTEIDDAELYRDEHFTLCRELNLLGRIIVAKEGINGTLSGLTADTEAYMAAMRADPRMAEIEFKIDPASAHTFPKLSIKAREEIVSLHLHGSDFSPTEVTGNYLQPEEWREMMNDPDTVMIDARNDYEWELGHFKGALLPEVNSFRELPQWVEDNREKLEGKKVMTYCTGGIRCEKFSGFLKKQGLEDVYQLHGGIVNYGKDPKTQGENFDGALYVFDERVGIPCNHTDTAKVITNCVHCDEPCDRYRNCAFQQCNEQHFLCETCEPLTQRYCTPSCQKDHAAKQSSTEAS